jgi:hypothetical protein
LKRYSGVENMSLNKLIIDTLEPFAPTFFLTYSGKIYPHITFFEINQNGVLFADNEEKKTIHYLQVDIWSKGDYTDLTKQVKESLIAVGFRRTYESELYEKDTDLYHKALRFNFVS